MAGYTKDFLIDAYLHRFAQCPVIAIESLEVLEANAIKLYDQVGRDKFRVYASLDAEALREYKQSK